MRFNKTEAAAKNRRCSAKPLNHEKKMKKVTIALKCQQRSIRRLMNTPISCCRGFGRSLIVVGQDAVSPQVNESTYQSIEEFDGRMTPDVEFDHLYVGTGL